MANDKKQYETLVSPRGVAVWPHLNSLDDYKGKTSWHTKLAFDPSAPGVAAFIANLDARAEAAYDEAKADPENVKIRKQLEMYSPVSDEVDDQGENTGRKLIKVTRLGKISEYKNKKPTGQKIDNTPPRFFDVRGTPIQSGSVPRIGGGSILKVEVSPSGFVNQATKQAGITLRLAGVQIVEVREFFGASKSGFGDEGDGFTVQTEPASAFAGADESTDDDGSGDF